VHGILHLIGHDHIRGGSEARRMKREHQRVMRMIRVPDSKRRA
jgi:ssRNA-specific RNase YbeY (16S rRNA maturation enzyme)